MAEQNIALNKPTSASSYVKPYESARAVNGTSGPTTPTSRWLCNSLPGWLMVDLGVNGSYAYWINRWVVRHMTVAGWQSPDYNMCDFKLQGSNDRNTWYDIDSVVGNTVGITDRTLATAVAYRYVRLYVTKGLKCNTQMASAMELEVYQSPPLSAYLQTGTGLTVSSGALSPAFVNNVFNYTTPNVANSVTSVAVKPTAEDSRATIKVNGVVVTSGNSTNVTLNVGSNAIKVEVTAADGRTTNTYTVTVVRDAPPTMASLVLKDSSGNVISLTPAFDQNTPSYTANVGNDITSIAAIATSSDGTGNVTVNGQTVPSGQAVTISNLVVGANTVTAAVVGDTKTYTVTVTRAAPSVPAYLSNIVFSSNASFQGTFNNTQPAVGVNVLFDPPDTFTLTPQAVDAGATITINGTTTINSGQTWTATSPAAGLTNTITLKVSAPGKSDFTYTLTALRATSPYLTAPGFVIKKPDGSSITYSPTFSKTRTTPPNTPFNAGTVTGIAYITVTPSAEDPGATVTVNGTTVPSGQAYTYTFTTTGVVQINIVVNSRLGTDSRTYAFKITKS